MYRCRTERRRRALAAALLMLDAGLAAGPRWARRRPESPARALARLQRTVSAPSSLTTPPQGEKPVVLLLP